jgi:hypothetical protein
MDVQVIAQERWETISQDFPGYVVLGVRMEDVDLGTLQLAFGKFTEDSQEQARLAEINRPTGEEQLAYRRAADSVAGDLQGLGNMLLPVAKALAELPEDEDAPEPEQGETPPEAEAEVEADEADAEVNANTEAEAAEGEEAGPAGFVAGKGDAYDYIPAWMEIPKLYSAENTDDPLAVIKLFTPDSSWTWFLIEYDPDEELAFGLAVGFETELGYISIAELREAKGPLGLKIERDLWWRPRPITQVKEYVAEWGEHGGPYKGTKPTLSASECEEHEEGGAVAEVEAEAEPEPQGEVLPVAEAIAAIEVVRISDGIDAALEKVESVRIPERETLPIPDPWTVEDVRFLLVKLEEGPVLVADSELGVRTIHDVAGPVEHLGFGLMQARNNSYTVDYDAGGAMEQTPSGQSWTFARVKEGTFPYDFDDERSKLWLYLISAATEGEGEPVSDAFCPKCGQAWAVHNDDGSCVQDEPEPEAHALTFGDNGVQVYFEGEAYLLLNPYSDRDGTRYSRGWVWHYRDESTGMEWRCLEDPDRGPDSQVGSYSLREAVAYAERVTGLRFELEGAPRDLPDSYPELPETLTRAEALDVLDRETMPDANPAQTLTVGMLDAAERVAKARIVDDEPRDVPRGAARIGFFPDLDGLPDGLIWSADVHAYQDGDGERALRTTFEYLQAVRVFFEGMGFQVHLVTKDYDDGTYVYLEGDGSEPPNRGEFSCEIAPWGEREVSLHPVKDWTAAHRLEALMRECYATRSGPVDWDLPGLDLARHVQKILAGAHDAVSARCDVVLWPDLWEAFWERVGEDEVLKRYDGRWLLSPQEWVESLGLDVVKPKPPQRWTYLSREERKGKLAKKYEGDPVALFEALGRGPNRTRLDCLLSALFDAGEDVPRGYVPAEEAGAPDRTPEPATQPADEDLPAPWQMTRRQYQESKAVRVAGGVPILNVADADEHRRLVEEALERGEIIPTHVFEDYPRLWRPWTWTLEDWLQMEHVIQRTGPDMRYHAPTGEKTLWPGTTSREEVKRKQHRHAVRVALAEGEHVPGPVLADYPDLEKRREEVQAGRPAWTYVPADERKGKLAQKYEGDHEALLEALEKGPSGKRLDLILSALADTGWPVPEQYAGPAAAGAPSDQPKPYRPDQLLAPLNGEHVLRLTGTRRHRTWRGEVLRIDGPTAPNRGEEAREGQWCAKYGTKDYGPEFFMVGKEIAVKADSAEACAQKLQAFLRGYGHQIEIVLQYPEAPADRVDPGSAEAVKRMREFHRMFPTMRDPERPSRELGWRRRLVGTLTDADARCIGCGRRIHDDQRACGLGEPALEYFFRDDAGSARVAACWTCWRAAGLPDLAEYTPRLAELYREWRAATGEDEPGDREAGSLVLAGMAARKLVLGGEEAERGGDFRRYCRVRLSERTYRARSGETYHLSSEDGLEGAVEAYDRGRDFPAPESWACIAQDGQSLEDQAAQIKAREGQPCTVVVDDGRIAAVVTPAWLYRRWQLHRGAIREDAPDDEETRRVYDAAARRMFRDGEAVDVTFCRFCRCAVQGALLAQGREAWEEGFESGADFAASPGWRDWVPYIGDRTPEPRFEIGDAVHYAWTDEPDTERRSVCSRQWREYEGEWHYKVSGKFWPEKSLAAADPEGLSAPAEKGEPELAAAVDAETLEGISATYSAKLIADHNRIEKPFAVDGADGLWICTGRYGDKKLKCHQVLPREAYAGETDADAHYEGRVVTYRKQEYVMTDRLLWVTLDESAPEPAPARKKAEADVGGDGEPELPDGIPAAIEVDLGHSKGWGRAAVIAVKGRWLHYRLEAGENGDAKGKVQVIGRDILWREAAQAGGAAQ